MAHFTDVLAVRIYTESTAVDTDIGLFAVAGSNSQLRWSEAPLVNTPGTYMDYWDAEMLLADGIGDIIQKADTRTGGNAVSIDSVSIKFDNTQQTVQVLKDLGIHLNGLMVEIIQFTGTTLDSDSEGERIVFTGSIEDIYSDEVHCNIQITSSMVRKRRVNLAKVITETDYPYANTSLWGDIIPLIFGCSNPIEGRYFKIVRTNEKNIKMLNYVLNDYGASFYPYPPKMSLFPAYVTLTDTNKINVRIGELSYLWGPSALYDGLYIFIKKGPSDLVGIYRKISGDPDGEELYSYGIDSTGEWGVKITLRDYMPVNAIGNYAATIQDQTWVEFYDIDFEYSYDFWKTAGFFDSVSGIFLDNKVEVYGKENSTIKKILSFGCDVVNIGNKLSVDPIIFDSSISNLKSMHIEPCLDVVPYQRSSNNLTIWGVNSGYTQLYLSGSKVLGVYASNVVTANGLATIGDKSLCLDRVASTSFNYSISLSSVRAEYYVVFKAVLPPVPRGLVFTKAYLAIRAISTVSAPGTSIADSKFIVMHREYISQLKTVIDYSTIDYNNVVTIDNIPDFYYKTPQPSTGNKNFYVSSAVNTLLSNYALFELKVNGSEEYENIEELIVMFFRDFNASGTVRSVSDLIQLYDIGVIFESESDISEEVYA